MQLVSDPSTKKHLDELWDDYGVYHYAYVGEKHSYPGYYSAYVAATAKALEMMSALMNDRKNAKLRPSYTIVFFWANSPESVKFLAQRFTNEVSLDVFVFMGFFRTPNINFKECFMVPPTFLPTALDEASLKDTYLGNLGPAFTILPSYSDRWPSKTKRAVAVGVHGLWYTPCAPGPVVDNRPANYSLGHRCGYACKKAKITPKNQTTSILNACMQPAYNRSFYLDTTFEALVAFDVKQEIIFTYDSASNLRSKLCHLKRLATNVTNFMAAVDIQYEDYNNTCGHGRYPRLNMLKRLSEFFSYSYTSPAKEAECLAIT
ncbi:uncharacterized protein LOC119382077 [Rhipicephalus sanguineus]|uniref:uncharacterized protein LOC119382077 n=1 Tax=Rhipicephalus sanguineus TaxID=34632 RepID=UPI0020C5922C|nr:uncharacterized protein LOC119382077 [Rhipicephalus sanguineus]